jgi:hypothetical protein
MKSFRFVVMLMLLMLLVKPAGTSAQELLDWLNGFSGPGPFYGHFGQSVTLRAMCIKEDGKDGHRADTCFLDDADEKIKVVIAGTFSWASSHDNPRFADDPTNTVPVNSSRIEFTYSYRVSPMLDVGVGVGTLAFTGDGVATAWHPLITPVQMTFVPFGFIRKGRGEKWGRLLRFGFADRYVLGDINAKKDFGSTSSYLTHGEFNPSFSIGLDILSLFAREH